MTRDELAKAALRHLKRDPQLGCLADGQLTQAIHVALEPYRLRDEKTHLVDGVEVRVPPYKFDANSILWVERQVRRTLVR